METLGQQLQAARQAKKLTASEAAKGTRIKIQHIQAMERDDFSAIPAPAYAKGFIRIYAEFLELDPGPLVQEYMDNHAPKERASLLPEEEQEEGAEHQRTTSPLDSIKWPSLPKIPWQEIRTRISKITLPKIKLPTVPPRLLVVYTGATLLFLLFLFTVIRWGRAPDEVDAPIVEEPAAVVAPRPAGDPIRPEPSLPMVDELPEPYLE